MKKYVEPLIPGKYYHVYNRACGFEKLFIEDKNYHYFLGLFEERMGNYLDLYCYCLIPNHFHLLVRIKEVTEWDDPNIDLSKEFSNLFSSYAMSFNRHYNRRGSLFSQNYRRKAIENLTYLRTAVVYIHRNPMKHGLVDDLKNWQYSSYNDCVIEMKNSSRISEVIEWFGDIEIFKFCHLIEPNSDIEYK